MPKLADWLKEKVSKAAPFTYTELDYIGSFYVKEKKQSEEGLDLYLHMCNYPCSEFGNR